MNIQETLNQGLKREYKVTIPASYLEHLVDQELAQLGTQKSLPGFRPGKIPMAVLRQKFGDAGRKGAIDRAIGESTHKIYTDFKVRPALTPKYTLEKLEAGSDMEFAMAFEILPEIKLADFKEFKLTQYKVKVAPAQVQESLDRIASDHSMGTRPLDKPRPTKMGDTVIIDFEGDLHGKKIPNATDQDYELRLGSRSFVDTFEDQLVGKNIGDKVLVHVNFPANYHGKELAGQHVHFDVTIKKIFEGIPETINDSFAEKIGFKDLNTLKETIEKHLSAEFDRGARSYLKQDILDSFSEKYTFAVPSQMVELEFETIKDQLTEGENGGEAPTPEQVEEWKKEYFPIAERRVRLGLVLAEIANQNGLDVTTQELSDAIVQRARSYPGQEKFVIDYFKNNEEARAGLRGPLLEEKVIDFVINHLPLTTKEISYDEMNKLIRERQSEGEGGSESKDKPKKTGKKKNECQ